MKTKLSVVSVCDIVISVIVFSFSSHCSPPPPPQKISVTTQRCGPWSPQSPSFIWCEMYSRRTTTPTPPPRSSRGNGRSHNGNDVGGSRRPSSCSYLSNVRPENRYRSNTVLPVVSPTLIRQHFIVLLTWNGFMGHIIILFVATD